MNQINEQSHNQAVLTLTAERQELIFCREAIAELQRKYQELSKAHDEKVLALENEEMAHNSLRLLHDQLHDTIQERDIEIRQLRAKVAEKAAGIVHTEQANSTLDPKPQTDNSTLDPNPQVDNTTAAEIENVDNTADIRDS